MSRWILGLALASTALGCRRFDVCGTDAEPCEAETDGASLGGAGAGGDGGQSAATDCSATHDNCDRSTLNGCETDLLSNRRHCGACDNECTGLCSGGACVGFDIRVPSTYDAMVNVLVTESEAFFVASSTCCLEPAGLGRYDLESGDVTWLVRDAWSEVTGLAASATRVYVIGDYSLYSMERTGGELRDEGITCDAISAAGTTVAAIVSGAAYVRTDDGGEFEPIPGDGYVDAIAATRRAVFLARDTSPDPGFSLEEHDLVYGAHEILAAHSGYARALHVIDDFTSAYIVTEAPSSEGMYELYDLEALAAGEPLVRFPWDSQWALISNNASIVGRSWIGTYSEGSRHGLRLMTFGNQSLSVDWPTAGVVGGLTASETDLWFVDPLQDALVSVDVDTLILAALTARSE